MDIQGTFFSPWELDASGYGENVRAFYLDIQNPAPVEVAYKALNKFKGQDNENPTYSPDIRFSAKDNMDITYDSLVAKVDMKVAHITTKT